jgi:dTDP-4-amino-4,6-dideoxygalactose transaminase
MQPIYRNSVFVTEQGVARGRSNAYIDLGKAADVGADIFARGLCLPSDNKMTMDDVDQIVEIIKRCFE